MFTLIADVKRQLDEETRAGRLQQLAAAAIENGATLCSNDTDFGRFLGLSWVNPLTSK